MDEIVKPAVVGDDADKTDLECLNKICEIVDREWGIGTRVVLSSEDEIFEAPSGSRSAFGYWKVEICRTKLEPGRGRASIVVINTIRGDALKMALRAVTPDPEDKY